MAQTLTAREQVCSRRTLASTCAANKAANQKGMSRLPLLVRSHSSLGTNFSPKRGQRGVQRRHGRSGDPFDKRLQKRWDRRIRWADARTGGESDGRTDGGSDDRRSGWTKRLWDALERPGGTVGRRTGGGSTAGRATHRRVEERLGQTHGRALTQFTPADPGRSLEFLLCT